MPMPMPRGRRPKWQVNAEKRATEEFQKVNRRLTPRERSMAISLGKKRAKLNRKLPSR